jgi:hypothetical protein
VAVLGRSTNAYPSPNRFISLHFAVCRRHRTRSCRLANAELTEELLQLGMTKLVSAVEENALLSIRCTFERESNRIDASDLQQEKHNRQITSSDPGR